MDLTEQERELIEIIREKANDEGFRLLIERQGVSKVTLMVLVKEKGLVTARGTGPRFEGAWDDMTPTWSEGWEERQRPSPKSTENEQPTTLMDISFDVDAYLANGGKLFKLMMSVSDEEMARIETAVRSGSLPVDRVARVARFLDRVGKLAPAKVMLGSALSEDRLQMMWRETAQQH
jgi:hypothetical protein